MRVSLIVPVLLAAAVTTAGAQAPAVSRVTVGPTPPAASPLRADPKVRTGTLPNGLRYYVRQNALPAKRAELRLVVNAGSVLETEQQLGNAHFLEHMAFNGTRNFARNDMIEYLQSIGVKFGADLNAYTSFDETVYILPVPTDSAAVVRKAFQILEDWAHGQLFDSAQVVAERGIVLEEWRGRKGAQDRIERRVLPVALKGSRYATRLPIGTERSIASIQPSTLRDYYRTWYRPDLMAVVAVGDFDPAAIERQIRTHFGRIARPARPRPRPSPEVPGNVAPLVAIATDPEYARTLVQVAFKQKPDTTVTVGDYRRDLVGELYVSMLNARLGELTLRPDAPFLGAGVATGDFYVRGVGEFLLSANVKDGGAERGLEALLTETRRVDQHGFLQAELDRARQNTLRAYERAFAERDKTPSGALVDEYVDHFLRGDAFPGIEAEYELAQQLLPVITLSEVNRTAQGWITEENRFIAVRAPEKAGLATPTEQQLLAVFARTAAAPVVAYTETVSDAALIAQLPPAGRVAAERTVPGTKIVEWTLSNGARVLVLPTDYKADEVLFSAFADGGTSLASNADVVSASLSAQLVSLGGVGTFSRVDLGKRLSGKAVRMAPTMSETSEGLSGSASPRDLETMLQLAHLQVAAPRKDTLAYQAFRNQAATALQNRGVDPNAAFMDSITVTMSQHDVRNRPLSLATLGEISLDRAFDFYRERYADAANFTFVFVGNVEAATLKPLVERYLASLPSTGRRETWKPVSNGPPTGVHEVTVRKGSESKATTLLAFTGPARFTPENRFALRALTDYMQIRLDQTLREQLGGSYSPGVGGRMSRAPREEYLVQVVFPSSPENVTKLTPAVFALIDTIVRAGPSAADVEKVRAQMARSHEVEMKQNSYWLANLVARSQAGEDLAGVGTAYDTLIAGLTPAMIQQAAVQYLKPGNHVRFVLLPETPPAK